MNCAKCATPFKDGQIWHIVVGYRDVESNYGFTQTSGIHVCSKCLMALGLNIIKRISKEEDGEVPTMGELIKYIVEKGGNE